MPPAARKKQQYECAAKEFELTREAMRALNIEADFKGLPLFDKWSRYTERRQDHVITDNRKHNKNRIARAKAAAEAAAASEAGSSQAGPSRTASVTALARTLRCAPKTLTELVDGAAEDHPSQTLSRIDAMLAPPDPNKPREVFRSDFKKQAIMWELRQNKLARQISTCTICGETRPSFLMPMHDDTTCARCKRVGTKFGRDNAPRRPRRAQCPALLRPCRRIGPTARGNAPCSPPQECKAALLPLLLDSILKWYPTDKIFKARVHTKAQAAMLLAKMRELYPASTDLPLTLEAAGEWNPACVKEVAVVPTECVVAKSGIEVGQVILNDGNLYPLREPIKALGFTFVKDFNNVPGQDFWVAPADKVDLAALAALYEKWGWDATLYDGAE